MNSRTILPGTFDGVHLGHRHLIQKAREIADGTTVSVLTFNPHPDIFMGRESRDYLLTTPDEREELLLSAGADEVITLGFDSELQRLSPQDFFKKILLEMYDMKKIVVGEDFRFGNRREGDVELLCSLSQVFGVEVFVVPSLKIGEEIVKSERIRMLLKMGEIRKANEMLGRLYSLRGKVIKGQGLGHRLGCPTANLYVHSQKLLPRNGVYAVKVKRVNCWFDGICYIGRRPTIAEGMDIHCEVHLFDITGDFLGETLEVSFVQSIRGERKFVSLEELSKQIQLDIEEARHILYNMRA